MRLVAPRWLIAALSATLVWEVASRAGLMPGTVPAPDAVVARWIADISPSLNADVQGFSLARLVSGGLVQDAARTLARVGVALVVAVVLGVPLGLAVGGRRLGVAASPTLTVLGAVPAVAALPLLLPWWGGEAALLAAASLAALGAVAAGAAAGVNGLAANMIRAAHALGADAAYTRRRVVLPGAAPAIIAGLRRGCASAFLVVLAAEMVGRSDGLGHRSLSATAPVSTGVLATVLTIVALGLVSDGLLRGLGRRVRFGRQERAG